MRTDWDMSELESSGPVFALHTIAMLLQHPLCFELHADIL